MYEDLWQAGLEWQAYLEEATAGIPASARARAVREELRAHLEDTRATLLAAGLPPAESAREALRRMGPPELLCTAPSRRPKTAPGADASPGSLLGATLALPARAAASLRPLGRWVRARRGGIAAITAGLLVAATGVGLGVTWRQATRAATAAAQAQASAQQAITQAEAAKARVAASATGHIPFVLHSPNQLPIQGGGTTGLSPICATVAGSARGSSTPRASASSPTAACAYRATQQAVLQAAVQAAVQALHTNPASP